MNDRAPVRVLCVDDNFLVVDSLVARLGQEPWIVVAGTLSQADDITATVERARVDIVLLDVDMPGRDSFTALRELSQRHPHVRTIMLSGHVRHDLIDQAVACGAWGYLSKSVGPEVVVDAIRAVRDGEFALSTEGIAPRAF
jgi:DNA-binding NarL/FixJ family response regulator